MTSGTTNTSTKCTPIYLRAIIAAVLSVPGIAFAADPTARATLTNVTTGGATSYSFEVKYSDDGDISDGWMDGDDIRITGPNGFDVPAAVIMVSAGNHFVTATYAIIPPGGSWDSSDNGTYAVNMQPNQVFDMLGNPVMAGTLGSFTVTISGPPPAPAQLLNVSTRLRVQTGENVLIGGFIVTGNASKKVIARALGPSLANFGLTGVLQDPTINLNGPGGSIASNDNWKDTQQTAIQASGLAPADDHESALIATLSPGNYTAVVQGKDQTTGLGLVEVYDLDSAADSKLANITTRGFVDTGSNILIGGFVLGNGNSAKVVVRALGPSLTQFGINGALANPTLDLRNSNGDLVRSNDDWKDSQQAEIQSTGLAPTADLEAAVVVTLQAGAYTALVSGKNGTTGVGLIEVYQVQ